jgi:glycosyltransferase involved in cell wall biosynthesis
MKIGFDAKRLFQNNTGLGNYSRTLVKNLDFFFPDEVESHLFTPKIIDNATTNFFLQKNKFTIHTPTHRFGALWRTMGLNETLRREKVDIFHGLSHEIPVNIRATKIPTVVTMHDLIFKIYPDYYPTLQRYIYDWKFRFACQNADQIIAISEQTKHDIIDFYNIKEDKITVIYQTCDERFQQPISPIDILAAKEKYKLPSAYMLYVGSIIERKNLLRIVEALRVLPLSLDIPLVIIGDGKAYKQKVIDFAKKHHLLSRIIFLPHLVYAQLPAIYAGASVFLYPSEYEGFGIPVIEALFCKVPVITANCACLPEAAGADAMLVDPKSSAAIADAITTILTDTALQNDMKIKGLQHAKDNFSAEKVTQQTYDFYKKML